MSRKLPTAVLVLCVLALLPAACDRRGDANSEASAEDAGGFGTVEAFLADGTGADSDATAPVDGRAPIRPSGADGDLHSTRGHFRGTFIVALYSEEGGFWVDIGRRADMESTLGSPLPATLVESVGDVPAGTYDRIRVLVCHSSVELEPGSRVGARTVDAPSSVHLTETGDVIVEREVEPFRVGPGGRVELDIDLNTERWLTEEAVRSDTASVSAFEREVSVRVRGVSEE